MSNIGRRRFKTDRYQLKKFDYSAQPLGDTKCFAIFTVTGVVIGDNRIWSRFVTSYEFLTSVFTIRDGNFSESEMGTFQNRYI